MVRHRSISSRSRIASDREAVRRRAVERVGCLCMVLASPWLTGCVTLPPAAKQQISEAEGAYRQGNYPAAIDTLNIVLGQYPDCPESSEAYYLRALCHARQSNKSKAVEDAQRSIRLCKDDDLKAKAHATVATLLWESGKTAAAIHHYSEALKGLPETPPTDLVRFRYGLCLQREGQWGQARGEFTTISQKYPGSELAEHARRMSEWPVDGFKIQCGAFRDKAEAARLAEKLGRAGLSTKVESQLRSGETLQMVYVGQYSRYEQAQQALRAVRRHVSDSMIVP